MNLNFYKPEKNIQINIMIFLLIYYSFSKQVFNFIDRRIPDSLILNIRPMELIEINIWSGNATFFSAMKTKFISVEVETENYDGRKESKGIFDEKSDLVGVVFRTKNYTLKIFNEGEKENYFCMIFGTDFRAKKEFSDICYWYTYTNMFDANESFDVLTNSIIYNTLRGDSAWGVAILIPCLTIVYLFYACCCKE